MCPVTTFWQRMAIEDLHYAFGRAKMQLVHQAVNRSFWWFASLFRHFLQLSSIGMIKVMRKQMHAGSRTLARHMASESAPVSPTFYMAVYMLHYHNNTQNLL